MPEPIYDQNKKPLRKPPADKAAEGNKDASPNPFADLHRQVGNRAVQKMLQRSGSEGSELDDETAERINASRGGGQSLDSNAQEQMGRAMNYDFSGVQVHTSSESDQLNRQLGAEAFTTGKDIFFKDGSYDPDTGSGQQLLAHELTHVVQQGTGQTGGGGGKMRVNQPGDEFEQQADSVAETVVSRGQDPSLQLQPEEEEEMVEMKPALQRQEEEEELQMKPDIQRQEEEEEEELLQPQPEEEEELLLP